jgi:hypothetical protein
MRFSHLHHRDRALTSVEILAVIVSLFLLAAILLPFLAASQKRSPRIRCVNNLKEDVLAIHIWEGDHNDHWPQSLSITNGGARELLAAGNVAGYFEVMSNELSTPIILACPTDNEHPAAHLFSTLTNTNIGYFVSVNADQSQPKAIVFADDNFSIDDISVKPGVINLWTNRSIAWTAKRHHFAGNVALADGSVRQMSNAGLTNLWVAPGAETNWVVIP